MRPECFSGRICLSGKGFIPGYGGSWLWRPRLAYCAKQRVPDQLIIEVKTSANQGLNGFGGGRDDPPLFCQHHHSQRSLDRNRENPSTLAGLGVI
jgi:hypothetical protein